MYLLDGICVLSFGGIARKWTLTVLLDYMWYIGIFRIMGLCLILSM